MVWFKCGQQKIGLIPVWASNQMRQQWPCGDTSRLGCDFMAFAAAAQPELKGAYHADEQVV
jgi:hypothetical protein